MVELETDLWWMSLLVFLPGVFALGLLFFPRGREQAMCWWSLAGTALTLGLAIGMFINYRGNVLERHDSPYQAGGDIAEAVSLDARAATVDNIVSGGVRLREDWVARVPWVPRFRVEYFLGVDGINLPLILLTALLGFLAMIPGFQIQCTEGKQRFVRGYCMLFLLLETGILGSFLALDFFLFYVFFEVILLPMYFLIGVWGGKDRLYAALKFFLYTQVGSVCILVAILGCYFTNVRDFVRQPILDMEVDRHKADFRVDEKTARREVRVNSFDLLVLARAGQGAREYIRSGGDVRAVTSAPELDRLRRAARDARDQIKELEERKAPDGEVLAAQGRLAEAEKEIRVQEKGLEARLKGEWFFQPTFQYVLFALLFVGFAIKIPLFPFHTWLPDAHVQAPTPVSMILAGVLLKIGGYGLLRIVYPICPWAAEQLAAWVALLGVINIVYGAFVAMAQEDFKKLVAYSSVSHMGYVVLGIAAWSSPELRAYWALGMTGAMFQMVAHGLISAAMFFCVGVIADRAQHRHLGNFRGLYEPMPLYSGLSVIVFFAAMGLPGLCGFWGEVMVMASAWNFAPGGQQWVGITCAVLAASTTVVTAGYILWTIQRVFLGQNPLHRGYKDISLAEVSCLVPLVVLTIVLGLFPSQLLVGWMEPSLTHLVDTLVSSKR